MNDGYGSQRSERSTGGGLFSSHRQLPPSNNQNLSGRRTSESILTSSRGPLRKQSSNMWHHSLPKDHNPWNAGLDTQRIAHELEWDDQQLDEEGMTSARLARAKAFAANHFVHKEMHPHTKKFTPQFRDLDERAMVATLCHTRAFAKNLRELKYKNRRLANRSSQNVIECMTLDDAPVPAYDGPGGAGDAGFADFAAVDTKPYSTGVLSKAATGVRSLKELQYRRSQEHVAAGRVWLARDASYLPPGMHFRRVNAFHRDTYVTR